MLQPIRTHEEYEAALKRVQDLQQRSEPDESDELELLLKLIEYFEKRIVFLTEGKDFVNSIDIDFGG